MGILNIYKKEYKKTQLPKLKMSDKKISEELKLIADKKSTLSARERMTVKYEAIKRGIK